MNLNTKYTWKKKLKPIKQMVMISPNKGSRFAYVPMMNAIIIVSMPIMTTPNNLRVVLGEGSQKKINPTPKLFLQSRHSPFPIHPLQAFTSLSQTRPFQILHSPPFQPIETSQLGMPSIPSSTDFQTLSRPTTINRPTAASSLLQQLITETARKWEGRPEDSEEGAENRSLDGRRSHNHGSGGQHRRGRNEMGGGKLPIQPSTRLVCRRRVQRPAPDLADLKEEKPDWKQRKKSCNRLACCVFGCFAGNGVVAAGEESEEGRKPFRISPVAGHFAGALAARGPDAPHYFHSSWTL